MTTGLSHTARLSLLLAASGAVVVLGVACGGREDAGTEQEAPSATADDATTQAPRPIRPDPTRPKPAQPGGTAAKAAVPDASGRVRIENGGAAIELPADFPDDIPIFPDATPTLFSTRKGGATTTMMTVDETMSGAHGYYQDELEGEGWSVERRDEIPDGDLVFINATKDGRVLLVGIVDKKGETVVSLIETPE